MDVKKMDISNCIEMASIKMAIYDLNILLGISQIKIEKTFDTNALSNYLTSTIDLLEPAIKKILPKNIMEIYREIKSIQSSPDWVRCKERSKLEDLKSLSPIKIIGQKRTRFGHLLGSKAAMIDFCLEDGTTLAEACLVADCTKKQFIYHVSRLIKGGIRVCRQGDWYRADTVKVMEK